MQLLDLLSAMERIAPTRNAEAWDNVGLLTGDATRDFHRVLLTIDYTSAVAAEAEQKHCQAVIAYHPPIFDPLKRITAQQTGLIHDAIRRGIAIYSPHTAWDAADGGANDFLADAIGLTDRRPLRLIQPKQSHFKLVTFVPPEAMEKVRTALFAAGAGNIGDYSSCSFASAGTGTFLGGIGTNPAAGQSGKLESVAELRLETVVPISKIEWVVKALRESHPYEEPAFDLIPLATAAQGIGTGRIGTLTPPTSPSALIDRIKRELEIESVLVAGPTESTVSNAAVCAGAGRGLLDDAIAEGARLFFTGELPHHDVLKALRAQMTVVCALHSSSERASLKRLKSRLAACLPAAEFLLSEKDREVWALR